MTSGLSYRRFINSPYMDGQTQTNSILTFRSSLCRHKIFCKFIVPTFYRVVVVRHALNLHGQQSANVQKSNNNNKETSCVINVMKKSLAVCKQLLYDNDDKQDKRGMPISIRNESSTTFIAYLCR